MEICHIGTARRDLQVPRAAQTEIPAASTLPLDRLNGVDAMGCTCGLYRHPQIRAWVLFLGRGEQIWPIGTAHRDLQVPGAAQTEIPAASTLPVDRLDGEEAMGSICDLYM